MTALLSPRHADLRPEPAVNHRPYDMVAIGDPVLDLCVHGRDLPRWDDKHLADRAVWMAGGSEANAACAASLLGLRTAVFGRIGSGPEAGFLVDELQRFGVDTALLVRVQDAGSALAVVYLCERGERAITYVPMDSREPDWLGLEALLPRCRSIYLLPYDLASFERLSAMAHRAGTQVVVDVERAVAEQPDAEGILGYAADILCFNEAGFRRLTGREPSLDSATQWLAQTAAHTVAVSLGPRGALAVDRLGDAARQDAYACRVVDTTGAGDSFNAAFVSARLQGHPLGEALSRACAAAALCLESVGARAGLGDALQVAAAQRSRALLEFPRVSEEHGPWPGPNWGTR